MIIKKRNLGNGIAKKEANENLAADSSMVENIPEPEVQEEEVIQEEAQPEPPKEPEVDLFDIENIDFTQRQERRRGSRRRGYRRIDDRNLVSRAQEESENIKKSAFEEGYRAGLDKANTDLEVFRNNLAQFMGAQKDVFEYIAPYILEISVDIA